MKENKMTAIQKSFVALATEKHGENAILSRKEMNDVCNENGLPTSAWRPVKEFKVGHGQYQLPSDTDLSDSSEELKDDFKSPQPVMPVVNAIAPVESPKMRIN